MEADDGYDEGFFSLEQLIDVEGHDQQQNLSDTSMRTHIISFFHFRTTVNTLRSFHFPNISQYISILCDCWTTLVNSRLREWKPNEMRAASLSLSLRVLSTPTFSPYSSLLRSSISPLFSGSRDFAMSSQTNNSNDIFEFSLSSSTSLKIYKGDITQWSINGSSDAIELARVVLPGTHQSPFLLLHPLLCVHLDHLDHLLGLYYLWDFPHFHSFLHVPTVKRSHMWIDLQPVNAANEKMLGGGGVDGAIHRAAGPELKEACYKVPEVRPGVRCPVGEARITPGFRLLASHVIHTVGPIYDADKNPEASLKNAYRKSLLVAKENKIQYIAFPAISCGVYGYPYDEAASVAISAIKEFADDLKEVYFVLFADDICKVWLEKANAILGK
ncbi:hypothetical protein RDABS01_039672 [Bienertia sinuspersici]